MECDAEDPIGAVEAAAIVRVDRNHLTRLARNGKLPIRGRRGTGPNAAMIFERADVLRLAAERRAELEARLPEVQAS